MRINKRKMKVAMASAEMTGKTLAAACGMSESSISTLMNHSVDCRLSTLGKVAKALGVKVEDIIEEV